MKKYLTIYNKQISSFEWASLVIKSIHNEGKAYYITQKSSDETIITGYFLTTPHGGLLLHKSLPVYDYPL